MTDERTADELRPKWSGSLGGGNRDHEAPIGSKTAGAATRGDPGGGDAPGVCAVERAGPPAGSVRRKSEPPAIAGLWPEDRQETLLPAESFDDEPAGERFTKLLRLNEPTTAWGPDSPTITLWLGCRCAGWPRMPTSREFHEAVRAERPTSRQRAILDAWANQADWTEVLQAWAEHAYTMRELVAALRRSGLDQCRIARAVNRWAKGPAEPRDGPAEPRDR